MSRPSTRGLAARRLPFAPGALALSIALLPWAALAEENAELYALTRPESTIRLGVLHQDGNTPRLGQYTGLAVGKARALVDFSLVRRDDSGLWLRASGQQLGLDSREAGIALERQGQWLIAADFSRLPRAEPLVISTRLAGIGTPSQAVGGVAVAREVRLSTLRDRTSLNTSLALGGGFSLQANYRLDEKTGSRLFGRGTGQFLAEPIDSRTQQFELLLGYVGERLQLQAAYVGSVFVNRHAVLDVDSGADIALAPDNESHQLSFSGGYTFAPGTRGTFKLSYGRGTQNEAFYTAPDFPGNTLSSLNARLDTTRVHLGLSSRVMPDLTVNANLRWEDRDDKTPRVAFMAPTTGRDGFNTPFSRRSSTARLDAHWRLPQGIRLGAGLDYEDRTRSVLGIRQASWRERNDETAVRLEARANLSEALAGSLQLSRSRRGGSDYLAANNNAAVDYIDPLHFADRRRDKLRFAFDWAPAEAVSLQLLADESRDRYDGRPLGPESGRARLLSIDGTYTVSETLQWHAWVSRDENVSTQATLTGANGTLITAQTWQAKLRTLGDALGIGVRARPVSRLELGADLMAARDINEYRLTVTAPAAAALPDITGRRSSLRLHGTYSLLDNLSLRLDVGTERLRTNDWTWTSWTYADGTVITTAPRERADFIGVSLIYRMW